MRALIAIQRLSGSSVRETEYAATPRSATAPGIVNKYENARTLGSAIGVPAAGTVAASADMFTAAPATAIANPMNTTTVERAKPTPARRGRRDVEPIPRKATRGAAMR